MDREHTFYAILIKNLQFSNWNLFVGAAHAALGHPRVPPVEPIKKDNFFKLAHAPLTNSQVKDGPTQENFAFLQNHQFLSEFVQPNEKSTITIITIKLDK